MKKLGLAFKAIAVTLVICLITGSFCMLTYADTTKTFTVNGVTADSAGKYEITRSDGVTFNISNWGSKDWVRIYKGGASSYGSGYIYDTYGKNNSANTTITISGSTLSEWELGDYECIAFDEDKGGWSRINSFKITLVSEQDVSINKSSYNAGEQIKITATGLASNDFIRIYKTKVSNYNNYVGSHMQGSSSYSVSTVDWEPDTYVLVAYYANSSWKRIRTIKFTVGENPKKAVLDKASYVQGETAVLTTTEWSDSVQEYVRIYKNQASNYGSGFVAQTYGTWNKSEYRFAIGYEPGTYELIAFNGGYDSIIYKTKFTVTAPPENEYYSLNGNTLTFKQDAEIELTELPYDEKDGKLFVGWNLSDGTPAAGSSFTAETVLTAVYVDYNADEAKDFGFVGAEVRTGEAPALRFIFEKGNDIAVPNIAEYGAVVIPSDIIDGDNWSELTLDGSYTLNGQVYTPAVVAYENTYKTASDGMKFTACITGITDDKLDRQYTARGYIRYTDINGNEKILYTDSVSVNPYQTAKADLNKDNILKPQGERLEGIINKVNTAHSEYYADVTEISYNTPSTAQSDLLVRTVDINSGKGGNPITIVQLSDLHYNYINNADRLEFNPTVMDTYNGRTWGANGAFAIKSRGAINYALTADQVMITGDIMDYLSNGCIELMYREVWNKLPNAIISLGNHEYMQKMQGYAEESIPLADRYQMLQNVWKHNIYYSSKVIDNKVMVIQMHNGERKFYESQIAPLTADIEAARANGYTVLMFMHEALATNNPNETAVSSLHNNGTATENFCENPKSEHIGGNAAMDDATTAVYNLITSNADVIKGIFNGHVHSTFYTEIIAKTSSGEAAVIPQYTMTGSIYDGGHITKITVS